MTRSMRTLGTALLVLLLLPAIALADGKAVLDDCGDDERLSKKYTQAEYKQALKQLPALVYRLVESRPLRFCTRVPRTFCGKSEIRQPRSIIRVGQLRGSC